MIKNCNSQVNAMVLVYFVIVFFVVAVLTSCSHQHHVSHTQKSYGKFRYDNNPNFQGCKNNYKTLKFPN